MNRYNNVAYKVILSDDFKEYVMGCVYKSSDYSAVNAVMRDITGGRGFHNDFVALYLYTGQDKIPFVLKDRYRFCNGCEKLKQLIEEELPNGQF